MYIPLNNITITFVIEQDCNIVMDLLFNIY